MNITILFMDVDGTMTDGTIYLGTDGEVMKAFSVKDGRGIRYIMSEYGVKPVVLTGRNSVIVKKRCDELGISDCHLNVSDKVGIVAEYQKEAPPQSFAYIGDDSNDLQAMAFIKSHGGIVACPADADDSVKAISDYICHHNGGAGAVREFIDYLVSSQIQ